MLMISSATVIVHTAASSLSLALTSRSPPESSAISLTPIQTSSTPPTSLSQRQREQLDGEERQDDPQHDGGRSAQDDPPALLLGWQVAHASAMTMALSPDSSRLMTMI